MRILLATLALTLVTTAFAQTKVVVIPLGGDDFKPLQNVITVGLKNADFTSPTAAVSSIPVSGPQAPSRENPYLIVIGPGLYELPTILSVPSHVSIAGSGRTTTILQFDLMPIGMASGTAVFLGKEMVMSDLAIQNIVVSGSEGGQGVAITTDSSGIVLERVDVLATGRRSNVGIRSRGGNMRMHDVAVLVVGGNEAIGINLIEDDSSRLHNVSVNVQGSSGNNIGIDNFRASPQIFSSSFSVTSDTGSNFAIRNTDSSSTIFSSQAIAGSSSNTSIGVENIGASFAPRILNSIIQGSTAGLSFNNEASKASVTGSRIVGGVINDVAGSQCRDNYDAVLASVEC